MTNQNDETLSFVGGLINSNPFPLNASNTHEGTPAIPAERVDPSAHGFKIPAHHSIGDVHDSDLTVQYDENMTFHFVEDEYGSSVIGYGHRDKKKFSNAVMFYDIYCSGTTMPSYYEEKDVEHLWGLAHADDRKDFAEDWQYLVVPEGYPNAFPFTRILR